MAPQFVNNVTHLEMLELDALRLTWTQLFQSSPPKSARKEFLVHILAHVGQERAERSPSKAAVKALRKFESAKSATNSGAVPQKELSPNPRLVRRWGGKHHEVLVMERGYAYRGASYSSLSEIARHITGACWSGPRFFGLDKKSNGEVAEEEGA